jgi:hypothetical protein
MSLRVAVGIVSLVCGSICGMTATFKMLGMVDQVNERLPKEEQFDSLGWYLTKTQRLHREYKRLIRMDASSCSTTWLARWGLFVCSSAPGVLDFLQSERLVQTAPSQTGAKQEFSPAQCEIAGGKRIYQHLSGPTRSCRPQKLVWFMEFSPSHRGCD